MHTDIKQSSFYITTYVIGLQKNLQNAVT